MPMAPSCCEKIAALVARRWLPAVVPQRNSAFWPPHVQIAVLFRVGFVGPPVQCAFSIASALPGAELYFAKCGTAFVPISYSRLFNGFRPGAIWPESATISECRLM